MFQFVDVFMCGVLESAQQSTTPQGKMVVKAKVKVTKTFNQQSFTSTFNVEGWNEKGQCLLACPPGSMIFVQGELKNEKYIDQQTGLEKWSQKINASTVAIVPIQPAPPQQQQQYQGQYQQGQPQYNANTGAVTQRQSFTPPPPQQQQYRPHQQFAQPPQSFVPPPPPTSNPFGPSGFDQAFSAGHTPSLNDIPF